MKPLPFVIALLALVLTSCSFNNRQLTRRYGFEKIKVKPVTAKQHVAGRTAHYATEPCGVQHNFALPDIAKEISVSNDEHFVSFAPAPHKPILLRENVNPGIYTVPNTFEVIASDTIVQDLAPKKKKLSSTTKMLLFGFFLTAITLALLNLFGLACFALLIAVLIYLPWVSFNNRITTPDDMSGTKKASNVLGTISFVMAIIGLLGMVILLFTFIPVLGILLLYLASLAVLFALLSLLLNLRNHTGIVALLLMLTLYVIYTRLLR